MEELCNQRRIGEAKAAQIKAAIELGRRLTLESPDERPAINSPSDAATLVMYEMSALEQKHLRVILLNTRNRVLEIVEIYKGSVNSSQIHVGEIFKAAIRRNAPALIIGHNHPSGDTTPSPDDSAVTRNCSGRETARCGCTGPHGDRSGQMGIVERARSGVWLENTIEKRPAQLRCWSLLRKLSAFSLWVVGLCQIVNERLFFCCG
jgi:hypothetical protein